LRDAVGQSSNEEETTFPCRVKISTESLTPPTNPLFLCLTADESKLVVASRSVVTTWDVERRRGISSRLQPPFRLYKQ
ncbi:15210_t:CDS:1, partial [Acaulospora colombiana]